jgi:hypothetical protein
VLAEAHGRDLTPLAGFEPVDLPGVVRALQAVMERAFPLRPLRRLDVLTWNGLPVRETPALAALAAAGFTIDGPRASWNGGVRPSL